MPKFTFNLPDIGEGIAEAEIVAWHVKVGDMISEDQPLADMMTDKATVEMESPVTGVVTKVAGEAGDVQWNFEKFLVNANGEVVQRFSPTVSPEEVAEQLSVLLR